MKYDMICIEGIDKTCKDLVADIIWRMTGFKYIFVGRGLISMVAYAKLYNRKYDYVKENAKHCIFIHLTTEKEDWITRCIKSNEKPINFEENVQAFNEAIADVKKDMGDDLKLIEFNVSHTAVYDIACQAIKYIEELNKEEN